MAVAPVLLAYLLGSIPFGVIVSRVAGIGDIRTVGSGNIGATNVWRAAGFKIALWVYLGDIGKGVLAVLLAKFYLNRFPLTSMSGEVYLVITALACVLGSIFSLYLGFKGGKGVNTALGTILTLMPIEAVIALAVFFIILLFSKMVSLGSILAAITLLLTLLVERFVMLREVAPVYIGLVTLLVLVILYTHRSNIKRILNGTENKIGSSKTGGSHA